MSEDNKQRHDPFRDEDLMEDIAAFQPKAARQSNSRPQFDELRKLAAARGFEERRVAGDRHNREPLKALQFRLPQSQVEQFHELAFEAFGLTHGAKTALFLKMWETYVKDTQSDTLTNPTR